MDSINQVGAERRKESRQNVQNRVNSNREQVENIDTDYIGQNKKIILRNKSRECRTNEDTINSNTSEKMQEYATGGNMTGEEHGSPLYNLLMVATPWRS